MKCAIVLKVTTPHQCTMSGPAMLGTMTRGLLSMPISSEARQLYGCLHDGRSQTIRVKLNRGTRSPFREMPRFATWYYGTITQPMHA